MAFEAGEILEGKITGITKFGAFVSLPDNKIGMVHISEISNYYVKEISEHVSENQIVKVKILGIDPNGRISLSIKQAVAKQPEPSAGRKVEWRPRQAENVSFEDMMSKFRQESEEKISDLKKTNDSKYRH